MFAARGRRISLLLLFALTMVVVPIARAQETTVTMTKHPTLGNILTDSQGRTLYRFTRDTVNVSSACYNQCAATWPPLLITDGNPVAGEGVDGNLLGVLTRSDGTRQVMFNGMPLYYFSNDANAGETNGQRVRDIWFVVHPNTTTVDNQPVTVQVRQHPTLGNIMTDSAGKTLYMFTRDRPYLTVCYDGCATTWPPLLVGANTPSLAEGVGGTLDTILRDDGNRQVLYEGKPLYYYTADTTIGDTKGQGVGNVWYVVPPIAASAPAPASAPPAPAPAALPRTGDSGSAPLGGLAVLALLLAALGAGVRLRRHIREL